MQRKFFRNLAELIYALDRIADMVKLFVAHRVPITRRSYIGRFYTIVPNVVLPMVMEGKENDIVFRGSIEPSTILHIHENYIFVTRSLSMETEPMYRGSILCESIPGINLIESDELTLSLVAVSIADRISCDPSIEKIVKLLPNNLRVLVERAKELAKEIQIDIGELSYKISKLSHGKSRRASIVELRVWSTKGKSMDLPYEISYIKSFGLGYLKLKYIGGELDLRSLSFSLADTLIPKLLPNSVVEELMMNTSRAIKIIALALKLVDASKEYS